MAQAALEHLAELARQFANTIPSAELIHDYEIRMNACGEVISVWVHYLVWDQTAHEWANKSTNMQVSLRFGK